MYVGVNIPGSQMGYTVRAASFLYFTTWRLSEIRMKFDKRTTIYQLVILLLMAFSIAGCGSVPAASQPANGPFGLVYFRANQPVDSNVGAFYYYDFNTKQTRRLTDNNVATDLRGILWSPAAGQFVYGAGLWREAEIFTSDLAGHTTRLTSNKREDSMPGWSPDGKQIVYTAADEISYGPNIRFMNADGVEQSAPFEGSNIFTGDVAPWSPTGQLVAVVGRLRDQPNYDESYIIYIVDAQSGKIKYQLADGATYLRMDWSPDGRQLALIRYKDKSELYIWTLVSGEMKKIADLPAGGTVDWSPDGQHIAVMSGLMKDKLHIYTVRPDGTDMKDLTPDLQYAIFDGPWTWSPDSRCLVFSAVTSKDPFQTDLYVLDTVTNDKIKITSEPNFYATASWVWPSIGAPSCESIFQSK
jgi:dipeptidyl aminopeptidase/acylaminoacyl peptidase